MANPFFALMINTFKEAFARKVLLFIFILFSVIIILIPLIINLDAVEVIPYMLQSDPNFSYDKFVLTVELAFISQVPFLVLMMIFIIMASSFVPSMLQKGYVEFILSRPISRTTIILSKYIAGIAIVFLAMIYIIFPVWLIISIKTGVWHFKFLYSIFWFTFIFASLYSLIILTGLITRSSILTLIFNLIIFFPISAVFSIRDTIYKFISNKVIVFIFDFFYYLLPKPWDLRSMCESTINGSFNLESGFFYSFQPIITSIIFIITILSVSIYYFSNKDY
ncbi:MAG: hypothetical protein N2490_02400 [Ignavibacteria bacterium]|nr:hypothetical protein [Ignavibacteria bacterium]